MPRFHFASLLDAPVERVFAFHKSPGALERLLPPRPPARVVRRSGGLEPGSEVEIELRIGPFRQRWVGLHTEYRENEFFCDVQKRGPFRLWRHRHGFERVAADRCRLVDEVEFSLPLAPLGDLLAAWLVKQQLGKMFSWRHARTAEACGARVLAQERD